MLEKNQIGDLSPWVENAAFDSGTIYLYENPIDCDLQQSNIKILRDRGVILELDCP
jgi:hypothetical protein